MDDVVVVGKGRWMIDASLYVLWVEGYMGDEEMFVGVHQAVRHGQKSRSGSRWVATDASS